MKTAEASLPLASAMHWRSMNVLMSITAVGLAIAGIAGCFIPAIPGPLLSYCGVLCLLAVGDPPSMTMLIALGSATAIVSILDYAIPVMGAKYFKCSKAGAFGAAVGTFAGLFFLPYGLILGPFLGAFVVELAVKKSAEKAAMGGVGALLGFLAGTLVKTVFCVAMLVYVAKKLF